MRSDTYQSPAERASREATDLATADHKSALAFLRRTPPPSPGKSPSEKERLEALRKGREAAAAAAADEKRRQLEEQRRALLDEMGRIQAFGAKVTTALGTARHELRQAIGSEDLDAALEAADRVVRLEIIDVATKRRGNQFEKDHRGTGYFRLDAGHA